MQHGGVHVPLGYSDKHVGPAWLDLLMPLLDENLSLMRCGSDPLADRGEPASNYVISGGVNGSNSYSRQVGSSYGAAVPLTGITDGLSNTAAFSEKLVNPFYIRATGTTDEYERQPLRYQWYTQTAYRGVNSILEKFATECQNNRTGPGLSNDASLFQLIEFGGGRYDHLLPPNSPSCLNGPLTFDQSGSRDANLFTKAGYTATSLHAGGVVNVAFADGRVQGVVPSISLSTWRAMGTIAGGELVEGF